MKTKIQKWGNSQGVRLPKSLIDEIGISVGQDVQIFFKMGNIVIKPTTPIRKKVKLSSLVKKMPSNYKPSEFSWGNPQGKEVW